MTDRDLVGLVRMLDPRGGRHRYCVGELGDGDLADELGALRTVPGPATEPLWLAEDGTPVLEAPPRAAGFRRLTAARWALAPLTWRGTSSPGELARAVLDRVRWARRRRRTGLPPVAASATSPAGFLDREAGPGSLALFAATHPVTGDHLLTTNRWEAVDLGYGEPVLLGHLEPVAPVTGHLGIARRTVPWAAHFGRRVRTDAGLPAYEPRGGIDHPQAGAGPVSPPFHVRGWTLAAPSVARVEIRVDGRTVGRARTGLERPDLATATAHRDAPVCAFEYALARGDIPAGARRVSVAAVVHDLDGARFELAPVPVTLAPPTPVDADLVARQAQRRTVTRDVVRRQRVDAGEVPKLLVFTHDLGVGGAQLYLVELLERLVAHAGLRAVAVAPADGPLSRRLEDAGIVVHPIGPYPVRDADAYEAKLAELAEWAAPQGFAAVLANTIIAFAGVEVARLLDLPSVFAIHESFDMDRFWIEGYPPGWVHPYVRGRALRALGEADALVFEAEATRRQYLPHAEAGRLLTLPYGIELGRIDAFRRDADRGNVRDALGIAADETVLLCLGTIEGRKAQVPLVQAFAAVAADHPGASLVLLGDSGQAHCAAYVAGLRDHVERAGLSGRIRTLPVTDDPRPWLLAADVLVSASDVESLPRAVLEAMAFETPVLATSVFGLPEIIEDGRTGYLCEARDTGALAAGLDRVLNASDAERARVGRAAAERVRARHDPAAYAERFVGLLAGLPGPSQAPVGAPEPRRRAPRPRALPVRDWPEGSPRVLVSDAWLANAGDGAIALATQARVRRLAPDAAVLHSAYQADLVGDRYPELALVPPLAGLTGVAPDVPEMRGWGDADADRLLAGADVLLSQGGGFALEHYRPWERLRAWELILERGIPLALCAQTIGRFAPGPERDALAGIVGAAEAVGVREAESRENVLELGAPADRVVLGADEAFGLFPHPPAERSRAGVAVVLSGHPVARRDGRVEPAASVAQLATLLEGLVEVAGDEPLTLLSTTQGLRGAARGLEDDGALDDEVLARLAPAAARRIERAEGYLGPRDYAELVGGHRALLTMRMHPAILGMSVGTPAVVLTPAFKSVATFGGLGLGDVLAPWLDLSAVAGRLRAVLASEPTGAPQWRRLEGARRRAERNNLVIERLLAAGAGRAAAERRAGGDRDNAVSRGSARAPRVRNTPRREVEREGGGDAGRGAIP